MSVSKRHSTGLSIRLCGPPSASVRGGFAILGVFLLACIGLALLVAVWCMPTALRATDAAVLVEAGRGTEAFQSAGNVWRDAGKPGTARIFEQANAHLRMADGETPVLPVAAPAEDPAFDLWGGADPFLQQIFAAGLPSADRAHPSVMPLFLPRESRLALGSFLVNSRNPAAVAVLDNRAVGSAAEFMPVDSSAGQPLEATIYLTALLLQGNYFPHGVAAEIRRLAEEANARDELGEIETVYLDLLALGSRLQWQGLADLITLVPDLPALRRTAQVVRALEGDWPVFTAAALWTRDPGGLSAFLMDGGEVAFDDLKLALSHGKGAVELLLDRRDPVHEPVWRQWLPQVPVLLPEIFAQVPLLGVALKLGALFLGLFFLFLAINLQRHRRECRETSAVGAPASEVGFAQALLLAVAFGVTFLVFNEPLFVNEGQKHEFDFQLPNATASAGVPASADSLFSFNMDQISLISLGLFFVLQLITYTISCIKIAEIRRQPVSNQLKLKLLENEEQLFDTGLYIGLSGTIGGLMLLVMNIVGPSLMTAYASSLFGILFVALFKIMHLRPYRRRLLVESDFVDA